MPEFNKEQIYIVTGASSGIGKKTALLLNESGASVVAIARNEERLNLMKSECKYPENLFFEIKDLTEDIEGLPQYVKSLKEKYGKFSGMAYCAGIDGVIPLRMITYEDLQKLFKINYFAPIMFIKGLSDKRNNIGKGTSLVLISSIDAYLSTRGQSGYSGSKAALSASMKSIAKEITSEFGIRINCVLPSIIKTPMSQSKFASSVGITEENQKHLYPFGWGEPEDVANMIIYLLSDKAKYISGQNYIIDSGVVL